MLPGFHEPLGLDVNNQSGGLFVYIKASLPSKILTKFRLPINIQLITFETNLKKEKWLFVSICKPPSQTNQYFLDIPADLLGFYLQDCDNNFIPGDFDLKPSYPSIASFMNYRNFV